MTTNYLQKIAYWCIIILSVGFLLWVGSSFLLPIIYAVFFAIFLAPVDRLLARLPIPDWLSVVGSFIVVLLPIIVVFVFFGWQIGNILDSLPDIGSNLEKGVQQVLLTLGEYFPISANSPEEFVENHAARMINGPLAILSSGLQSTSSLLVSTGLTLVYTFFILLYRGSLVSFTVFQFGKSHRSDVREAMKGIKDTVQGYVGGMGLVMLFLAVINSIGLSVIGIKYALLWGAIAGVLAVIPYVGTIVGSALPFLYTLATYEQGWQPIAVVLFFALVQAIEGNIITPKIVGQKVDINPLFAIIALVFFGAFWGLGGVILAIPLLSIFRIIVDHFDDTQGWVLLLSTQIDDDAAAFET